MEGSGRILLCLGISLLLHGGWFWVNPPPSGPAPVAPPLEIGLRHLPADRVAESAAPAPSPRTGAAKPAPRASESRHPQSATAPLLPKFVSSNLPVDHSAEFPVAAGTSAAPISPSSAEAPAVAVGQTKAPAVVSSGGDFPGPASGEIPVEAVPLAGENPPPAYPRLARQRGWEGEVALRVRVSAAGAVEEVWVESTSGHAVLDQAALAAVKTWRFRPARDGVRAVAGIARVPIEFRLRGG